MLKFVAVLSALAVIVSYATPNINNAKIICSYDSSSFVKEGEIFYILRCFVV